LKYLFIIFLTDTKEASNVTPDMIMAIKKSLATENEVLSRLKSEIKDIHSGLYLFFFTIFIKPLYFCCGLLKKRNTE
jgi:hypothetical protein